MNSSSIIREAVRNKFSDQIEVSLAVHSAQDNSEESTLLSVHSGQDNSGPIEKPPPTEETPPSLKPPSGKNKLFKISVVEACSTMAFIGAVFAVAFVVTSIVPYIFGNVEPNDGLPTTTTNFSSLSSNLVPILTKSEEDPEDSATTFLPAITEKRLPLSTTTEPLSTIAEITKAGRVPYMSQRKPVLEPESKMLPFHNVEVESLEDYQFAMASIPANHEAIVKIKLASPFKWQNNAIMFNADKVRKLYLRGPFTVDILVEILEQTVNLSVLHLSNKGNKLCSRNEGQLSILITMGSQPRIALSRLKHLVLDGFGVCMEVHEMLSRHIEMKNLAILKLEKE